MTVKCVTFSNSDASESAEAENTDDSDIQDGTTDSGVRIYFDKLQVTE